MRTFKLLFLAPVFFILAGVANATQITVAQGTFPGWSNAETAPRLRIFLNKAVVTSDSRTLQPGSTQNGLFYQSITCSVSTGSLIVPQFTIDSLSDALVGADARYSAYLYTSKGAQIGTSSLAGFASFSVPAAPTTTTWAAIQQYNSTTVPHVDNLTYTRTQINAMLAAISLGLGVREVDASPTVSGASTIEFQQSSGFTVTDQGSHVARVDLSGVPYAKLNLASSLQDSDIASGAGISLNKLAPTTPSRAAVTDGSGFLSASSVTAAELGFLSGVGSSIQTQLNAKQAGDNDLTAIAALGSTGIAVRTGTDTWAQRSIVDGAGLTWSNGSAVGGNPSAVWNPSTYVNNISMWDGTQASRTLTANLSGASDPVLTFSNGQIEQTTGNFLGPLIDKGGAVYASLQAAIDAAVAAGKNAVVIPAGDYHISSHLVIGNGNSTTASTVQGFSLIGTTGGLPLGTTTSGLVNIIADNSMNEVILVNGPMGGLRIENIHINCNALAQTGIRALHTRRSTFKNIEITENTGSGFVLDGYTSFSGAGAVGQVLENIRIDSGQNGAVGFELGVSTMVLSDVAQVHGINLVAQVSGTGAIGVILRGIDASIFSFLATRASTTALQVIPPTGAANFPDGIALYNASLENSSTVMTVIGSWTPGSGLVMLPFATGDPGETFPSDTRMWGLSADKSWHGALRFNEAVTFTAAPIFSTLTPNSVPYAGASGLLSQDNSNFTFDATNKTLLLGGPTSTSPAERIHVATTGANSSPQIVIDDYKSGAANPFPMFTTRAARGTPGSPSAIVIGDPLLFFTARGYHSGAAFGGNAGVLRFEATDNFTSGAQGTAFTIETTTTGTASRVTRLRVEGDGGITVPDTVTGGSKGAGTINATGLYVNGVAVGSGGGTPGGANTQGQYDNARVFAGISGLTADGTNATAGSGNLRATSPRITTGLSDANGNSMISFTPTTSAVDAFTVTNAATANPATVGLAATGSDTNINIGLTPKGTGNVLITAGDIRLADGALFRWVSSNTYGFQYNAAADAAQLRVIANNGEVAAFAPEGLRMAGAVINFKSSGSFIGSGDVGISAISAGLIGVGTGAAGSTAGSLSLNNLFTGGVLYGGSAVGSSLTVKASSNAAPSNAYVSINAISSGVFPGNVLIGTPTANAVAGVQLQIQGSDATANIPVMSDVYGSSTGNFFVGRTAGGTNASPSATPSGAVLFGMIGRGWDTAWSATNNVAILFKATQLWTASAHGTDIEMGTTLNGTTTRVLRFYIDHDGSIVMGDGGTLLATNATGGFVYEPTMAGAPTGVPVNQGGTPVVNDSTNHRLMGYNYSAAAWGNLAAWGSDITAGSGTGVTVNQPGSVQRVVYKVTAPSPAWSAAATTADKVIATLPAKCRLVSIIADTTTKYIGGAVTACTLKVGKTTGGAEYVASHDVFTAAVTKGLADADLGTSMTRATAIQGGDLPSWTTTTSESVRITTTTANTNALTQGSTTYYLVTEMMP